MARFKRSAELAVVPRSLFDEVTRDLLNALEGLRFSRDGLLIGDGVLGDIHLVEGEHLAPGACYTIELPPAESADGRKKSGKAGTVDVELLPQDKTNERRVHITVTIAGHLATMTVRLRTEGQRLHSVRVEGSYQGPGPLRGLQRASWEGEARLQDWWSLPAGGSRRPPPFTLTVRHPLAFASVRLTRGEAGGRKRWKTRTTVDVRGRRLLRPFAAAGLLFTRPRIRRAFAEAIDTAVSTWNDAVPDVTGRERRERQERLTFRHQVTVTGVTRQWAEDFATALHEEIAGLRFKDARLVDEAEPSADVRLVRGEHIESGAQYRIAVPAETEEPQEPVQVDVVSWEPAGLTRVEFTVPEESYQGWGELCSTRGSAALRASVTKRETGSWEALTRFTCEGEGDLDRWWDAADKAPALTATAAHPLARAVLTVTGAPARRDRWTVEVTATVEGLDWARPLVAAAGLLAAGHMEKSFRQAVEETAEEWNRFHAQPSGHDPRQAAAVATRALLASLARPDTPDAGA
ncbi:hypothetical protein [Actinomadura sp. 9N407]|uniref:hypothetical protein n=1 Tax=Actinomadura sp. 9N407 TaxID=3375154 RepID=UPI00378DBC20